MLVPKKGSRLFCGLLVAYVISCGCAQARSAAVWIDTDAAIGSPIREVDDAFALILAFHSPELRIAGISSTYGNAGIERTTAVARELVRRFGAGEVYCGAGSPRAFAAPSEATAALTKALREQRLTYIALGPLTNLAAFLQQQPDLAARIERVIFVGGQRSSKALTFGPNERLRIHDANVFKDPAAVQIILRGRIPITLVPAETAAELRLTPAGLQQLRADGAAGKFLAQRSGAWMWFWTSYVGERGGPIFDTAAILESARHEFMRHDTRYALVDAEGNLVVSDQSAANLRAVDFCAGLRGNAAEFILRRLLAEPSFR